MVVGFISPCNAGHYGEVRQAVRLSDLAKGIKNPVKVAIKTVPKRRRVYVDMLRKEIGILRQLRHRNIVRLFDAFETEKDIKMVFEMCSGGELFEPISNQDYRFRENSAARVVRPSERSLRSSPLQAFTMQVRMQSSSTYAMPALLQ